MISLIWAMSDNGVIGKDNQIPWKIKEDLLYYKNRTEKQTVFMGENTYFSLKKAYGIRPLPYGRVYVASYRPISLEDAVVVADAESFLKNWNPKDSLWVVGGREIYALSLPYADRLYISYIQGNYEGDTYFPSFSLNDYDLIWSNRTKQVYYTCYERKKR